MEVPALQAQVAAFQKEVPALQAQVTALKKEVPALQAQVVTLKKEVADLKGGGQNGGAGRRGVGPLSLADWKTQACAILGVRTASQKMAPNEYDCFDQNCRTRYFEKQASLQCYMSHLERVHGQKIRPP